MSACRPGEGSVAALSTAQSHFLDPDKRRHADTHDTRGIAHERHGLADAASGSVGRPRIKQQGADIDDSDPRRRNASPEGGYTFIHSTKRFEDVTRTGQQGHRRALV